MPQGRTRHLLIIAYPPVGLSSFPRKAICQAAAPPEPIKGRVCFYLGVCRVLCTETNGRPGFQAPASSQRERAPVWGQRLLPPLGLLPPTPCPAQSPGALLGAGPGRLTLDPASSGLTHQEKQWGRKEEVPPGPGPRPPLVAGDTEQFFCWLQTLGPQTQCSHDRHCSVFSPSCPENKGGLQL